MSEGVSAIQEQNELLEALIVLRQLVQTSGLSWDQEALHVIEQRLGFPLGRV